MKIVINALSARLGGGQTYLKNLLLYLPQQVDLDILIYAPASLALPEDSRIRRGTTSWPTENPLLRAVWEKIVLPRTLRKEKTQILFCPGGILASHVPVGCKTVTMFRNMMPFDPIVLKRMPFGLQKIRNWILKRVMLRSMRKADLTIFISEYARGIIEKLIVVKKAATIPHGINSKFKTAGQHIARPSWLPRSEYLLYVSRFDAYKHQMEVVQAYEKLSMDLRYQYKLLLVGQADNKFALNVKTFMKEKKLEEHVILMGEIPYVDLPLLYHHASINIFASSCENCPNILLEALGAGQPVLSSSIMPMPEFVGNSASYFYPTDPMDIYEKLKSLLLNESLRKELSMAAKIRSEQYDWKKTAALTWNALLYI